ncbi:hypothetical protein L804_06636 [Cryptococcus deuterogattii 2001/935-1]|nr:hypothetical protein L804_06636 [Cryptococcus deuterogattii 2001/935-1]
MSPLIVHLYVHLYVTSTTFDSPSMLICLIQEVLTSTKCTPWHRGKCLKVEAGRPGEGIIDGLDLLPQQPNWLSAL